VEQGHALDVAFREFVEKNELTAQMLEHGRALMPFTGQNGNWLVVWHRQGCMGVLRSVLPMKTPAARRSEMMTFLTSVNWRLMFGCFEMDLADGEIAFRTTLVATGEQVCLNDIEFTLLANLHAVDSALPGLIGVMFGALSAEEAARAHDAEARNATERLNRLHASFAEQDESTAENEATAEDEPKLSPELADQLLDVLRSVSADAE